MFKKSLAFRILFLNIYFVILPMTIYFLLFFYWQYKEEIGTDIHRLSDIGQSKVSYLNQLVNDQYAVLDILDVLIDLHNPQVIKNFDRNLPLLHEASIGIPGQLAFLEHAPDGRFLVKYTSLERHEIGKDLTFREYVINAVENNYSTYLTYDIITGQRVFVFAKAIHSQDDYRVLGILVTWIPADSFINQLIDDKYFRIGQSISLLTEDKIVFATSNPKLFSLAFAPLSENRKKVLEENKQFGKNPLPQEIVTLTPFSYMERIFSWNFQGKMHITFIDSVANGALYILMDIEKAAIAKTYLKKTWMTVGVLLTITSLSCLITVFLSRFLSKTLQELLSVMEKISRGDLTVRFKPQHFGFEMNEAGKTLNKVLDHLVEQTEAAQKELLKTAVISQELKIGQEIQKTIFPSKVPLIKGLDIGVFSASSSQVSGNFYDLFFIREKLVITLTSTSGKGLFSCLYSVCLRSILRCFSTVYEDPQTILENTNRLFYQDLQNAPLLIQTFLGIWDDTSKTLDYASASPSFGFFRVSSGETKAIAGSKAAMGSHPEISLTSYHMDLNDNCLMLFYTSGTIERQNLQGQLYGENRLKEIVDKKYYHSAQELADFIADDLKRFGEGVPQEGDITFIILKTKGKEYA